MTTKVCPRCKVEKELEDFYNCKSTTNGKSVYCKSCSRSKVDLWRAINVEKLKGKELLHPSSGQVKKARGAHNNRNMSGGDGTAIKMTDSGTVERVNDTVWVNWYEEERQYRKAKVDNLDDCYVKDVLKVPNPPQELIELKRIQLRIHREIYKKGEAES